MASLFALCDDSIKGPGTVYCGRVQSSDTSHVIVVEGKKKVLEIKRIKLRVRPTRKGDEF